MQNNFHIYEEEEPEMGHAQHRALGGGDLKSRAKMGPSMSALISVVGIFLLLGTAPSSAGAQQLVATAPLVFDQVTVVDVEQGKLLPAQRVVVAGNRIQAVGPASQVRIPPGAQVVEAGGKYLIPGLWEMHWHLSRRSNPIRDYLLLLANGVTGFRDAGTAISMDTLHQWRREILAGARIGPPRQLFSGQSISNKPEGRLTSAAKAARLKARLLRMKARSRQQSDSGDAPNGDVPCDRGLLQQDDSPQACVVDSADAVHYVDSLKSAGADMIKPRAVTRSMYFAIAAEARRLGIPFGGHAQGGDEVTAIEASDSGASIVDHPEGTSLLKLSPPPGGLTARCWGSEPSASITQCQPVAERFRRNGTWWMPAGGVLIGPSSIKYAMQRFQDFEHGSLLSGNWLRDPGHAGASDSLTTVSHGAMRIMQHVGMPILAGTDGTRPAGFSLHAMLTQFVEEGLAPLNALQAATLNPAKMWHATDSLGTVAAGKLADLVLLDADPLADITNTTTIRAVVANGRYFDRSALDHLLAEVQLKIQAPKTSGSISRPARAPAPAP